MADDFFTRFLRYRFDLAALAFDCYATFFRPGRWYGRVFALGAGLFLFAAPGYVLLVGDDPFGNNWVFGASLVLTPVLLEAPGRGWRWRQATRDPSKGPTASDYDLFLFGFAMCVTAVAPIVLVKVDSPAAGVQGLLWGVALAGAQDYARTIVALFLTRTNGVPLYPSSR